MKSSILSLVLTGILCCAPALAWDKNEDYLDKVYTVQADQIETTGQFKRNLELMYNSTTKDFGISFYNYRNKGDQVVIPLGSYNIRGCGLKTNGIIDGPLLKMTFMDHVQLNLILSECGLPIYVRVYDGFDNYSTYRIESVKGFNELK